MGNSEKLETIKIIYDSSKDLQNGASIPIPKQTESITKPTPSSPDKSEK